MDLKYVWQIIKLLNVSGGVYQGMGCFSFYFQEILLLKGKKNSEW